MAAAAVAALESPAAFGRAFDVGSVAGEGPPEGAGWQGAWDELFGAALRACGRGTIYGADSASALNYATLLPSSHRSL